MRLGEANNTSLTCASSNLAREKHRSAITANWLLIHKTSKNQINFARLGTHQQLFKKY
jgi:mRNA-degrading endonuclease YafQ of YafQ-DinJ toxin-antitoxin module